MCNIPKSETYVIPVIQNSLSLIPITTLNHNVQAIIAPTMHHLIHELYNILL